MALLQEHRARQEVLVWRLSPALVCIPEVPLLLFLIDDMMIAFCRDGIPLTQLWLSSSSLRTIPGIISSAKPVVLYEVLEIT